MPAFRISIKVKSVALNKVLSNHGLIRLHCKPKSDPSYINYQSSLIKINKPGRTDRHKLTSFRLFKYWQLQNTSINKV